MINTSASPLSSDTIIELMTKFRTEEHLQQSIKKKLELGMKTTYESMEKILTDWSSRTSSTASLDKLVYILKKSGLRDIAENIRTHFFIKKQNRNDLPHVLDREVVNPKTLDCCLLKFVCSKSTNSGPEKISNVDESHTSIEILDGCMCPQNESYYFVLRKMYWLVQITSAFATILFILSVLFV